MCLCILNLFIYNLEVSCWLGAYKLCMQEGSEVAVEGRGRMRVLRYLIFGNVSWPSSGVCKPGIALLVSGKLLPLYFQNLTHIGHLSGP